MTHYNEQISFSLSDEVAPYFENTHIETLCRLIDQKQAKGLKYSDLKELLVQSLDKISDNQNPIHNRAREFAKYY